MNKQRRKQIQDNINALESIKSRLEDILADEEDYFENIPENLQSSMRAETSEEAIDVLTEAIDAIEECMDQLADLI